MIYTFITCIFYMPSRPVMMTDMFQSIWSCNLCNSDIEYFATILSVLCSVDCCSLLYKWQILKWIFHRSRISIQLQLDSPFTHFYSIATSFTIGDERCACWISKLLYIVKRELVEMLKFINLTLQLKKITQTFALKLKILQINV